MCKKAVVTYVRMCKYIDAREYVLDHSVWNKKFVLPEEFSLKHTGHREFFCPLASKPLYCILNTLFLLASVTV